MKARAKIAVTMTLALACALAVSACGSQGISLPKTDHCSGCHTLSTVGAEGSATSIDNRVKTNGPNFDFRKENVEQVMYALHNGGFSGAIMPENVVLGTEAREVARFLAKYSGLQAPKTPSVEIKLSTK